MGGGPRHDLVAGVDAHKRGLEVVSQRSPRIDGLVKVERLVRLADRVRVGDEELLRRRCRPRGERKAEGAFAAGEFRLGQSGAQQRALAQVEGQGTGATGPNELPARQIWELPPRLARFVLHMLKPLPIATQGRMLVAAWYRGA